MKRRRIRLLAVFFTVVLVLSGTILTQGESPGTYDVDYRIVFTDESHQMTFAETRTGTVPNGTEVYIGFASEVIVDDEIWQTTETPGPRIMNGPGTEIFYIVYRKVGDLPEPEDPDREAKEILAEWILKARQADSELTGTDISLIPEESVICDTEGKAGQRLVSAAALIGDTSSHSVYIIARGIVPTGIALKTEYGARIVYSNTIRETVVIGGTKYTVHCFGLQRVFGDACFHRYEAVVTADPTCTVRGKTTYICSLCGDEQIVYAAPLGHVDEEHDGICDVCGMPADTPIREVRWHLGDTLSETIDGKSYTFRCIDEDYSDGDENHAGAALFLCDSVIPAGYKGEYREEEDADGHRIYVWYPGPIATFGSTNAYKTSNIRAFLDSAAPKVATEVTIGIPTAYTHATEKGKFSQLRDDGITSYSIGYQKMSAKLFVLSLEEALKYKNFLWKFGGSATDNPETVTSGTCTMYWLRTPNGTANDYDESGLAYVVDLSEGNIHPMYIAPKSSTGDPYIDSQTTVGIRPAFLISNH